LNQSVTIFVTSTLKNIAPVPDSTRPIVQQRRAFGLGHQLTRPLSSPPGQTQAMVLSP